MEGFKLLTHDLRPPVQGGAPIFDGNGEFVGVLDVSSIDPALSEHAHALTGPLTISAARAIEERMFRKQFRRGTQAMTVSYSWRPFLDDTQSGGRDRYLHIQVGEVTLTFTTGETKTFAGEPATGSSYARQKKPARESASPPRT